MIERTVIGKHRFTCLSPSLVRVEYSPDGKFEDRRSILAYPAQKPAAFKAVSRDGAWDLLDTGAMQIRATENDKAFSRNNLEIRWSDGKLLQFWRPGDRDYQNLGGTLRSLDRYGGDGCELDGVHPATMESPDASGTAWPAWLQCEVDPLYTQLHPNPPAHFNQKHWLPEARNPRNDGSFLDRTFNWYKDVRKFCPGVLSASGYYLLNDSDSAVMDADDFPIERETPGYQDWYFFAYGTNYKQALADFRLLGGPAPVLPRKSLGIILSRWPAFTETEIQSIAGEFSANGYPLGTLVMDMEWHKEGWGHWEFNPELIPDPKRFFALCRKHGLDVTFNDHPLDVRDDDVHYEEYVRRAGPDVEIREREYNGKLLKMAKVDICNKQQNQAFCAVCHPQFLELGLDYWWNDGSRGQMIATSGQLVTNKTFFEESQRNGQRGMLLARYGGLGSHRYGGFFTGDATSDYDVLRLQCEFNIRAGGVGISSVSHDIGGFCLGADQVFKNKAGEPIIDPERYLRWLQFAVFGPILRFHSAPGCGSRKPYDYDTELDGLCRHWLRIRHSLIPYIYTATRTHHDTGVPVCRGLYLEDSRNPAAYRFDEYYFGPDMLVAPILSTNHERTFYLPPGDWWEFETSTCIAGNREITRTVGLAEVPVYVRAGSIIPRQNPDGELFAGHVADLWLDVYPGATGHAELYEDDGKSLDYQQGKFCRTRFDCVQDGQTITLSGRVTEGSPLGQARQITIHLASSTNPLDIRLADGTVQTWEAMSDQPRWQVRLPSMPTTEKWSIQIHLSKGKV